MIVIPAIDLQDGQCVRLVEGRPDKASVYQRDPVETAKAFKQAGARLLHVVDLDGAFLGGTSTNQQIIRRIARELRMEIELGGGIRSAADISTVVHEIGARYAVVGTLAIEDPAALTQAIEDFGDMIVVGIDARKRAVAIRGWTSPTNVDAVDLARWAAGIGAQRIIYTDIERDGRLEGPNLELTREIARESGLRVTASGGIASVDDIKKLRELEAYGVDSVIVGKALYENRMSLEDAIRAAEE